MTSPHDLHLDTYLMASLEGLLQGTNIGQRAAVAGTAQLLGDVAMIRFVPTPGEDEVWFVLPEAEREGQLRVAEQVIGQVLGRKVWITRDDARYNASLDFPHADTGSGPWLLG